MAISVPGKPSVVQAGTTPVHWQRLEEDFLAEAGRLRVRVDGKTGWLNSIQGDGQEWLSAPVRPNFWRVPTDNDNGWKVPKLMGAWKDVVAKARLDYLRATNVENGALIQAAWQLPIGNTRLEASYLIQNDASVLLSLALNPDSAAPELPRVGWQWAMPGAMNHVRWFGRGPHENYWDRKTGSAVGLYHSTVE
jgi:beta-galactosidase